MSGMNAAATQTHAAQEMMCVSVSVCSHTGANTSKVYVCAVIYWAINDDDDDYYDEGVMLKDTCSVYLKVSDMWIPAAF